MKKSSTAHSSRRLSSLALFHQPMDVNTLHSIHGRQWQSCPLCGFIHNPGDFTSLSYGGDVGDYDVAGNYCDGSFSYVPTPTSSTFTWPVAVNTADPNNAQVDVWAWIPTQDASASVDYAATVCKLETTNQCVTEVISQSFNRDSVSGWQYVGGLILGAGYYVNQITLSSADQQQNNMGEAAIGLTTQDL